MGDRTDIAVRVQLGRKQVAVLCAVASLIAIQPSCAARSKGQQFIEGVARDIATLRADYPQLADFSPAKHTEGEKQLVSYGYRTHPAERTGGWTSGVPNPDPDGIWFYIDVHDPKSTAQIHSQPAIAPVCLGQRRVSFLILEGTSTKPMRADIWKVLEKHGARECGRQ